MASSAIRTFLDISDLRGTPVTAGLLSGPGTCVKCGDNSVSDRQRQWAGSGRFHTSLGAQYRLISLSGPASSAKRKRPVFAGSDCGAVEICAGFSGIRIDAKYQEFHGERAEINARRPIKGSGASIVRL